ncbi:MAG: hypothetical protein ACLFVP_01910 [Candidatus Bathyarchaeia archaeon]
MTKNGNKAITILLISTIVLSLVPTLRVEAALGDPVLDDYIGKVGDTVEVTGEGVTAGSTVNIYWDSVGAWNPATGRGLLGSTEANPDGTFDLEFDVPEAKNGAHYVWVKDLDTGATAKSNPFTVISDVEISTSSGLEGDDLTVDGMGFVGDGDVVVGLFADYGTAPVTDVVDEDTGEAGDGSEDEFSFTLDESPIKPGSLTVTDGVEEFTDDGEGSLTGNLGGEGSVNYVTGEVEVEFDTALGSGVAILASYSYFENVEDTVYLLTVTGDTNVVGSFSETVTVPDVDDMDVGAYEIVAFDAEGNTETIAFTIGAVITLDMAEGPVGSVVGIEGRGFDPGSEIDIGDITIDGIDCYIYDAPIEVESDGDFSLDMVIPQVDDEDDYTITVTDGTNTVTADFEVTALAELQVTPDYGLQGEKVTVSGVNFVRKSGEDVVVTLGGLGPKTFETDSDGTFGGTFTIPGVSQGVHTLKAEAADFNIMATKSFKAGLIVVVATPDSVKVGEKITFTGTGFTGGEEWNATFGDMEVTEEEPVQADGTFTYEYYVPTVDPGTYVVTFVDLDSEIHVSTEVTVTDTTMLEIDPSTAPNEYRIIVTGWNFKNVDNLKPDFTLYNDTDDWDITNDVKYYDEEDDIYTNTRIGNLYGGEVTYDGEDGSFAGWWEIYDSEELSLGTYTLKVEVDDDWVAEIDLEIIEKTVTVSPRRDTFRVGDTVAFDIVNSFQQEDSYVEVYEPAGDLYWKTDEFIRDVDWIKVGTVYRVPYFKQTAGENPMILVSDAPLGTWTYTMFDGDDEEIASGSFTVAESAEAVLEERINELGQDIVDLQDDLTGVKDGVSEAKNSADEAKAAADAATEAIQEIGTTATDAKNAADDAKTAANEAKDAATGIQTLVYVAIGASVIAALAAIVSLMQISRRIAG